MSDRIAARVGAKMMTSKTSLKSILTFYAFSLVTCTIANPTRLDTSNFPSITTYTSLGDSYASGPGAGHLLPASLCGRFSAAYPARLAQSLSPVRFHSAACGGASTSSVIRNQLSWIGDSDLVTLTVGGNEVNFFGVLNECVYQWRPLGTCEGELRKTRVLIESSGFIEGYAEMLKLVVGRMKHEGRLLVTGYATFFNEETAACENATFSRRNPKQYLTRQLRRELNHLVRMLNHVIRSAAEASGADYVDIDKVFNRHRFCDDGVGEPDDSRSDTWFFNLDNSSGGIRKSEGMHDGEWQEILSTGLGRGFVDVTRVFHPTKDGHGGIRDAIIKYLEGG
jgi:GDSL-like Lipase/Acylhydrolase family